MYIYRPENLISPMSLSSLVILFWPLCIPIYY